jgi:AcrR family transcriptional regulator
MKKPRELEEIKVIKERILDAALDVIVKEGYSSLTMRRLATRLSMTAPNIYNYYRSKDEIYINLVIRGFSMLNVILKEIIDEASEPYSRAKKLAKAYITFGINNSSYYDIMFTYPTPKYNDFIGTALEKLSEIEYKLSMGIVDFVIKEIASFTGKKHTDKDVRLDLIAVWSMLHGMVSLYNSRIIEYTTDNPNDIYDSLIDAFLTRLNFKK